MPHRLPRITFALVIALVALIACTLAAPVAADDAVKSDPYAADKVQQEGTNAPKNAEADETPAPLGVMPITGTLTGGCVAMIGANGVRSYQQTVYTITPAGFTPSTQVFADALCTAPLTP